MSNLNSFIEILFSFGKIGLFSLGGGNSMIKMIEHECVNQRNWLTIEEFNALTGGSFLFPGLTAVKIAGLIGLKVAGVLGLCLAALAINFPGILLSALMMSFLISHQQNANVTKLIKSMQYADVDLFASAL
ncbi:MAG: chromate transporter, partial [Silvanigrellaceae bacterium]|nr:chromate transporter [Silvanigrellaceae bacterium]